MIFIAVGTQKFQFNRLLQLIDEMIDEGKITDRVFAQSGNSNYLPRNYEVKRFLDKVEFDEMVERCDLLITHCGVGTIISGLKKEKPIIVFPRLSKYHEHVDDHQLQLADSFSSLNYVLKCGEDDDLSGLIEKAKTHVFRKYISYRENMIHLIEDYLKYKVKGKKRRRD